jgi:hypothetical protein
MFKDASKRLTFQSFSYLSKGAAAYRRLRRILAPPHRNKIASPRIRQYSKKSMTRAQLAAALPQETQGRRQSRRRGGLVRG